MWLLGSFALLAAGWPFWASSRLGQFGGWR
jgi:hypothetical protein